MTNNHHVLTRQALRAAQRKVVCVLQKFRESDRGRLGAPKGTPAITCPARFEQSHLLIRWLAEIVGFPAQNARVAREVPFMRGRITEKPAGKIDLVIADDGDMALNWYGLEVQAVYFSGPGMSSEFRRLASDTDHNPPFPNAVRRPDWRSSSAKRLLPQLQVKVPTLRRWSSKMAVAVDRPFFEAIGGPSPKPTMDINEGDVIWLVSELKRSASGAFHLSRWHSEVLTLEACAEKLLAAETIRRDEFESELKKKLESLS